MKSTASYPLNGADRFQLFFDNVARKNTGTGNVIRAAVSVKGIIPEKELTNRIVNNEAILQLNSLSLGKKWYSPVFYIKLCDAKVNPEEVLTYHDGREYRVALDEALSRDCSLHSGRPYHIDIIYTEGNTHLIFSVNHVLMDYSGMENLLAAVGSDKVTVTTYPKRNIRKSFSEKLNDSIHATSFVASLSSWNMKRLKRKRENGKPAQEKIELPAEDTKQVIRRMEDEIKTNSLSFFLGSSLFSFSRLETLPVSKHGKYFIAVPVDRRSVNNKDNLLSNYLSFIYFHEKDNALHNIKDISESISRQMIAQARREMPEKFSSLLDLFRFIPPPLYKAFIDLPSKGNSSSFAFSLLSASQFENKLFMGLPVTDVTHYAPVISPPGLNIVFSIFRDRLKIILSFDEDRISKSDARILLTDIRKNLLG